MAEPVIGLTQADRDLIQRFLDEKRRSSLNTHNRGREGQTEHEEWLAPEVYIAKVSTEIPALVGSGGDADAEIGNEGDEPGYASCDIYQIRASSGVPKLRKVGTFPKRVYNLFGADITETPWIPVVRDKFGSWLALGGITAADVGTGSDFCGNLILDCPDTPTAPCCETFASSATLTYKIGGLEPATMSLAEVGGDGYVGENHCVVDEHIQIFIQFAVACFETYWAMQFVVAVYVDEVLDNYVDWDKTFFYDQIDEEGYVTCDPFSLHYEGLNSGGETDGANNPQECGTGSDAVAYPFTDAGGLLVTLDVVE